jgi:hypothetical protein
MRGGGGGVSLIAALHVLYALLQRVADAAMHPHAPHVNRPTAPATQRPARGCSPTNILSSFK